MATDINSPWFPLFEFQDWIYQSFLILPTPEESSALPGTAITSNKWAKGMFVCGQAFKAADGYTLSGTLSFDSPPAPPGTELQVSVKGALGPGNAPATFEATGAGTEGVTKGAIYRLFGWVFPEEPVVQGAGRVLSIRGSVWAVRGPDTKPDIELGRMPIGTVGAFVIERAR
jgi:hypothetical protein